MDSFKSRFLVLSRFIHHYLLWFLISAYVIAAFYPALGLWIRDASLGNFPTLQERMPISLLMLMLSLLMFNAGLGVKAAQLRRIFQKKLMVFIGLAANVVVPVAYIFAITLVMRFWYEPVEAQYILIGLALVAAMPIAGASTAWAQNSDGNLALSLGLVLFSTILSPIVTPVALQVFGEMAADEYEVILQGLAGYRSVAFLGLWVVLPAVLGLLVRFMGHETWLDGVMPYIKVINSIDLLLLNYSNASVSLPKAIADRDLDFLLVTFAITTGLCIMAFASGYWLSRLFELDQAERISLMYGLGMNNNGTGLVLASLTLSSYPRVMVPIIFYNLAQHIVAGIVHECTDRTSANEKSESG